MSTITVRSGGAETKIKTEPGVTLLDVLRSEGFDLAAPCGGLGKCGKCSVALLAPDGRRERVLACRTPAEAAGERVVLVPDAAAGGLIELAGSAAASGGLSGLAAAVDLGTTTLAVRIIDRASGEVLSAAGDWSAQSPFGADVISRIKAASRPGGLERLCGLARNQAAALIEAACRDAGVEPGGIEEILCVGNTTMEHLFAGLSPEGIGRAPYTPASCFTDGGAVRLEAFPDAKLRLAPCVSGYIGGDAVAAIYAAGLAEKPGARLLMDIGTNGELVLARDGRLTACSVACGPAFEGAEIGCGMRAVPGAVSAVRFSAGEFWYSVIGGGSPRGICGTGIVDALAALLESGVMDGTGRLLEPDELPEALRDNVSVNKKGRVSFVFAPGLRLRAAELRKLQLAKAAVRAGAEILMRRAGVRAEDIDEAYLAGGFGTRLDIGSAAKAGLIAPELAGKTRGIGNAALDGAQRALCTPGGFERLAEIQGRCEYVELSGSAEFSEAFVDAMPFYDDEEEA